MTPLAPVLTTRIHCHLGKLLKETNSWSPYWMQWVVPREELVDKGSYSTWEQTLDLEPTL